MIFNRRKKWNGQVASLLPTFDLTIEIVGPMAALEALDMVYPKGFSPQEGALYLAYLTYSTFIKEGDARADNLKNRIGFAEEDWIAAGRVNPKIVSTWREKAKIWESALR
ncbi:hypothetical protein ACOI1H_23780 [Loktanella sp. DJP18]|uniref:hypothetical protein n=1 Tax=Loktanella sp. DJP18 TaxID=3409788 RepID=UPI003BB6D8CD